MLYGGNAAGRSRSDGRIALGATYDGNAEDRGRSRAGWRAGAFDQSGHFWMPIQEAQIHGNWRALTGAACYLCLKKQGFGKAYGAIL